MNSRITPKFQELREKGKKALITYITCGDPDLGISYDLVLAMERAGSDIIELGIPYSDPLADGPVIQRSSQRALQTGVNLENAFTLVSRLREKTEIPLVFLVYYNVVFKYGTERFIDSCQRIGIDGLIIPDLPSEERREIDEIIKSYPLDLIPMVAPTSGSRIKDIVAGAKGFVYCVSSKGVTGSRELYEENLKEFINSIREHTSLPLAIGFGISNKETVKELRGLCDGVIIGSAIIQRIEQGISEGKIEEKVSDFTAELAEALA